MLHLEAESNLMHCYDDKDDFALALRVALAEVQRGSWECGRGGSQLFSIGPIWWGGLIIMILRVCTWFYPFMCECSYIPLFFSYIHDLLSAPCFHEMQFISQYLKQIVEFLFFIAAVFQPLKVARRFSILSWPRISFSNYLCYDFSTDVINAAK